MDLFHHDLLFVKKQIYEKIGFELSELMLNPESSEYAACSFRLNDKIIQHRLSKITPKKIGQFVTIWKRNALGITSPYDISDHVDFLIVTSKSGDDMGQFIFPKHVLIDKGIFTNKKTGKRGMRVYPTWDHPKNKQAQKTQSWQSNYFLDIRSDDSSNLDLAKKLLSSDGHFEYSSSADSFNNR